MGILSTIFKNQFRAATPENPRFDLNSPQAWDTFLDGCGETSSGVSVTRDKAETLSAWWRGVNLISKSFAKVPLYLYRATESGKEEATDHPAYRLVYRQPNPRMTAFRFWRVVMNHKTVRGNGLAYIFRPDGVTPTELWPVDPDTVTPVVETIAGVSQLWYVIHINGADQRKIPSDDMLHFMGHSNDGKWGKDLVKAAKETLGLGIGGRKYESVFFKNSGRPSVIITFPTAMDPGARDKVREGWERMFSGLENAHRTAVIDRGGDVKTLSTSAEDAQLTEVLSMNIRDIANFLEIPAHKLSDIASKSYASNEQEDLNFLTDCLDPHFVDTEQECEMKLLTEEEKASGDYCFEFDRICLFQADLGAQANFLRTATAGKPFLTQNEARAWVGFNPAAETTADELGMPLNMGQGGVANQPNDPATTNTKPTGPNNGNALAAQEAFLSETVCRMVRRVGSQGRRAAANHGAFEAWAHSFRSDNEQAFEEAFGPVRDAILSAGGKPGPLVKWFGDAVEQCVSPILECATPKTLPKVMEDQIEVMLQTIPPKAAKEFLR